MHVIRNIYHVVSSLTNGKSDYPGWIECSHVIYSCNAHYYFKDLVSVRDSLQDKTDLSGTVCTMTKLQGLYYVVENLGKQR